MDATGTDRPTALVHGSASALLGQVAVSLAERGYDVHLTPGVLPTVDVPGWTWRRLHVAPDGEQALLAAVAGQARPLEVAVFDVADATAAALLRTVATYQRASGRGRLLRVARAGRSYRARRRGRVERALDDLLLDLHGPRQAARRHRASRLPLPVATRRAVRVLSEVARTDG